MSAEDPVRPVVKSRNVRRTLRVNGRRTSVCLEDGFRDALKEIAVRQKFPSVSALVSMIDNKRLNSNLSSAIRLFVLDYYREQPATRLARP
jgi:predicted DNA-binding ribbon-helix-helix protein